MKNLVCSIIALITPFSSFCTFEYLSENYIRKEDERADLVNMKYIDSDGMVGYQYRLADTGEVLFTHDLLKQTTDVDERKILKSRIKVLMLASIAQLHLIIKEHDNKIASSEQKLTETTSTEEFNRLIFCIDWEKRYKEEALKAIDGNKKFLNSVLAE